MKLKLGWQNFYREIDREDRDIDLGKASLYIAQAEYPDLNIDEYLNTLDLMSNELSKKLPEERYPLKIIKVINNYLFAELGYQGNRYHYYDPCNSFLSDVIDRRTGIPITLSVIYLEIAKRINFPMVGIGMPGHFLIRPEFENVGIFVDPFHKGEILFEQDCQERLQLVYQKPTELDPKFIAPVEHKLILMRMLTNLKYIYINTQELLKALEIAEAILMLFPDNLRERRDRGLLNYQLCKWDKATKDLKYYLETDPNSEDADQIRQLLQKIG